jgi:transforming growth factor-beta-induced protein
MRTIKLTAITALTLGLGIFATAYADNCGTQNKNANKASAMEKSQMDIVETAVAAESFNTLVAAVKAAGLVEALKGEGPFTVLAPTDEAFARLPQGTVENLLKDKEKLAAILTYHVIPGEVMAADVMKLDKAETLQGQSVTVTKKDGAVMIDNANVVKTDIVCSNGVIHVIDHVILPGDND